MDDFAIRVEGVSKSYKAVAPRSRNDTLRDQLARTARGLLSPRHHRESDAETVWALEDVSLEVRAGETIGIIGRNGAGKSTLLKILAGITDPTQGRARIRGRIGALLEVGTGFHSELTGRENVFLNGAILGLTKREIQGRFDEIVAFAGVERYIDVPVKRYSSGMQLRLAMAVAAHIEPEILLVDEVLAVGDIAFQRKCIGKLGEVAQHGRTVLFVSHNLPMLARLCPRSILLQHGRVAASGPTPAVIEKYLDAAEHREAERVFPARTDTPACIRRVTVLNDEGAVTAQVAHSAHVTVEVEYDVSQAVDGNRLYWMLHRSDGTYVLRSLSQDFDDPPFPTYHEPGTYRARVRCPGGLLNAGMHNFGVELRSEAGVVFDHRDGGFFTVIDDTDYASLVPDGAREGAILQRLEWTRQRVT